MNCKNLAIGLGSLVFYSTGFATDKNPNIVFILADDLGIGDVSVFNEFSKIKTPNIDKIAQSGVMFTDAHSSSAVCTPTRYGILTGRYNWRSSLKSGVLNGFSEALIPTDRTTMAGMLKKKGYTTACIGKWHLGWNWNNIGKGRDSIDFTKPITNGPVNLGFDYFYGFSGSLDMPPYVYVENDRPTALPNRITVGNNISPEKQGSDGSFWLEGLTASDFDHSECLPNLTRRAEKYIADQAGSDKPFFLYLPLPAPHTPILPSVEFKGKSALNNYGDFVLMVDDVVAQVNQALKKHGLAENTILILTSDNGCSPWADYPFLTEKGHNPSYIYRGHKADLFEGGHRIPCVLQWPARIRKPHVINQTICLNDFMATFAEITGYRLAGNEAEDSFSLLPALLKPGYSKTIREATVHHSIKGSFAIRKGSWKLLLAPGSGGWSEPRPGKEDVGLPPVQLYNLDSDPQEKENLAGKYPEKVDELTMLLKRYVSEGRSTPGMPQINDGQYPWEQLNWMSK